MLRPNKTFLALLLFPLLTISALPVAAQRRPATTRKAPPPAQVAEPVESLDTLLADEQYRIYSEVRNVGTLVRSQAFNEFLEPLVQFAGTPEQFATVLNWIKAHAELLAGSRLCVVSWPSKNTLPQFVFAIELASTADAKKLEAELRAFLPKLDPKPKPSPSSSPPQPNTEQPEKPGMFAQLQIQQVGALVLLSEKRISLPDLKPARRRLFAENPNFVMTRNRFASEPMFVYVDFKAIEKEELQRRQKWEEEGRLREEQAAANPTPEPFSEGTIEFHQSSQPQSEFQVPPPPEGSSNDAPVPVEQTNAEAQLAASFAAAMQPLSMALFGGRAKYPEALGVALALEGDSYSLRGLLVNSPENRSLPVPFVPQLVSAQALTPASPNVLPGESELFIALSLDYSQIYEAMVKAFADQPWLVVMNASPIMKRPASPFSAFEEKVGVKVKEDLLPLLGTEIGFILAKPPAVSPSKEPATGDTEEVTSVRLPELMPVIAISIKDREAVRNLIPKMFESMGLKGAAMLGHSEKRGDAEIISYVNIFSYAFIGDFLVFAPDPALTRWAVDSYVSNNTLSSNSKFRHATRWQGRQVQGQVYVTSDLVEKYLFMGKDKPQSAPDNQPVEPLTYMLSNEGLGPVHEAHVPRSFVQMVVAGMTSKAHESPIATNESIARNVLRTIASAQATFRKNKGDGRYGSLDELSAEGLITKDLLEKYGYKVELSVLSNRFEVTAAPVEYGKTGKRSFYVDESGILRGGDHGGGAATLSDKPINE